MNEYLYEIEIGDTNWLVNSERFFARAVNIVRLASGQTVPVNPTFESRTAQHSMKRFRDSK